MSWQIGLAIVGVSVVAAALITGLGLILRNSSAGLMEVKLWRDGSWPFGLMLDDSMDDGRFRDPLHAAVDFWNRVVPGVFVSPGAIQLQGAVVPVLPHTALADWKPGRAAWTRISVLKGRIWSAAIYVDTDKAATMSQGTLRRVFIHELGHVLGLAHSDGGVMADHLGAYTETLSAQDKTTLRGVYG